MNRRLVVLVPDLSKGGGERVTRCLLAHLDAGGWAIKLVSSEGVPESGIRFFPVSWRKKVEVFLALCAACREAGKGAPILAVLTGPAILASFANILLRRRLVIYEHSDVEKLYGGGPRLSGYLKLGLAAWFFRRANRVAVVSPYLRDRLVTELGCRLEHTAIVENPFQPFLAKLSAAQTLGGSERWHAYIIGRDSPEKRIGKAVRTLLASKKVGAITIISNMPVDKQEEIRRLPSDKEVSIYQDYRGIETFDSTRSFLLNFGRSESFSLVIAEWLSSHLPVISVYSENLESLWAGRPGFVFLNMESGPDIDEALSALEQSRYAAGSSPVKPVDVAYSARQLEDLLDDLP